MRHCAGNGPQTLRQWSFCLSLFSEVSRGLEGIQGLPPGNPCRVQSPAKGSSVLPPEIPTMVRPAGPSEGQESEELARRQRRHPELSQGEAVASVIIYRTLAGLLPHNYDPDKRSLR